MLPSESGARPMRYLVVVAMILASAGLVAGCEFAAPPPDPVEVRYGSDPSQFGVLHPAAGSGPAPVVVLIHGGFWAEPWDYTLMTELAESAAARGVAVWNIEFRRLGGGGGWPETFDDVRSAIDHLEDLAVVYPLDLGRVVTAGHSSGGHLALWAARPDVTTEPPVRHALGIAAVTDLSLTRAADALLGASVEDEPERWAGAEVSLDPNRVRLVHGTNDATVPIAAAGNARDAGVDIVALIGADHFDPITGGSPAFDHVVDELVALAHTP